MAAWRVDCRGCTLPLAAPDHVEFLQENERSVHFGLRRSHFEELSDAGKLRSRHAPAAWSFTRRQQTHIKKSARVPSTLRCPSCDAKVGSEIVVEGWFQPEFLFDSKACDVAVEDERLSFSKFTELLRLLAERKLEHRVRSPTSSGESEVVKTRRPRPPPMVFPTSVSVRDYLMHTSTAKTLSTLRDYQMELLIGALLENTIVYLPTGCGKTLVAVHVISAFKNLNPGRKAVFLVPTVPLVTQQACYLRRESDLSVLELSGQNISHGNATPHQRRAKLDQADALVVTPQFFANMLFDRTVLLEEFCVLVFDEAHHAAGQHPYCNVLRRVQTIEAERRPRVVGLTASPFGQRVTQTSLFSNDVLLKLFNAYDAMLDTPIIAEDSKQLAEVFKKVEWITDEKTLAELELEASIKAHVLSLIDILATLVKLELNTRGFTNEDQPQPNQEVYALRGELSKLAEKLKVDGVDKNSAAKALTKHIRRVLMVIPRLAARSPAFLARSLLEFYNHEKDKTEHFYDLIKQVYVEKFAPVLARLAEIPAYDELSSKVRKVASIVEKAGFDGHSRAIVFVHQRKTAEWLVDAFAKIPVLEALKPTKFVGHSGYEGMNREDEQRIVLEMFRKGTIRMLVATNVLEEGLDVPDCSLVVRFDGVIGMTSLVQSRGRARRSEGRFIVMGSKSSRQQFHEMVNVESALFELASKNASQLKSKNTTRELMKELVGVQACTQGVEGSVIASDLAREEWTELDKKICVMFGPMISKSQLDHSPVLSAIQRVGFVEIDRVDTKLCLVALETSDKKLEGQDYTALYDRLCRNLSFRASRGSEMQNSDSFWIKMISTPPLGAQGNADLMAKVLAEEHNDPIIECVSLWRGRFVRQDTFEREEELSVRQHETYVAKTGTWLVCEVSQSLRVEFDLLSVHNRVVWIETKACGEWTVYFTLHSPPKIWETRQSSRVCDDFHMKSLSFAFHLRSTSINALRKELSDHDLDVRDTTMDVVSQPKPKSVIGPDEPLMVTAAKLSLLSSCCFAIGDSLPDAMLDLVRDLPNEDVQVQALLCFEPKSTTAEDLVEEFEAFVRNQEVALSGLSCVRRRVVFKAIVTPTRILFDKPELAPPNRVFRAFDSEHFLYVYFRDENRERADFSDDTIAERVRRILSEGIYIGRSHFRFLGCSLSQLRNASCIFTLLDPESVRRWMGDLNQINSPPKYLKRLGQSFSSSREAIKVHPDVLRYPAEDIKDDSGHYEFTDGCGEITRRAAQAVASKLNLYPFPSAFQIRLGGAKGVLVVSDFDDTTTSAKRSPPIGEYDVRLRKSMVKFTSPHHMLEIVAHSSAHSLASLTRQSVLILSALGIPDAVFMDLQDEFMECLAKMVVSDWLGLQEIRASVPPDQIRWLDMLYGDMYTDQTKIDLYHRQIIHAIYQYRLTNTVMRARIPVTKGRILMGVADFTGTLDYGEVFVQYSERDPSGASDLTRLIALDDVDVLVHRSPCHHPGDIRVLRCRGAGTVPQALRQLHDCIVFPTRGPRPHPDECTGGDLDGDVFTVIWDQRLVPPRSSIVPAMTLSHGLDAFAKEEEPRLPIDESRLIDFCLFALKHDILGPASNAHLAVSDIDAKYGCFATNALVLAEICAREVDCCKDPRHMDVVRTLSPSQYPDFMQNQEKPSYKSHKVLGKMYRRALALSDRTAPNFSGSCGGEIDESFLTDGYLKYKHTAALIYQDYKHTIRMMLKSCGAETEAELATGMIIEPASEYRADYFRFGERSRDAFYRTHRLFREEFERIYGSESDHTKRRVAAAWYVTAYGDKSEDRLLSFPWILADSLIVNKKIREQEWRQGWHDTGFREPEPSFDLEQLVACKLQLSILRELEERSGGLLAGYQERLQALTELRTAIQPNFNDIKAVKCVLFGSSAMLTFEPQSDLDVVVSGVDSLSQLKELAQFVKILDCVSNVKMRERTHVPVLSFSIDEVWSIEISLGRNGPRKTALFRAYMEKYPFFWPTAYFLIKWGKAAGLIRRRCLDGSNEGSSMFLPVGFLWLFLRFCLEHEFVQQVDYPDDAYQHPDTQDELSFWTRLLQRSQQPSTYPSAAEVMLAFFGFFGSISTPQGSFGFTDPLDQHNDTELTAENVDIFRELCYVARHQLLVSNGDLEALLRQQPDHRRRITLSRAFSKHVHRSPDFFAAKILRESGALSRDVALTFSRHPNALRPDLYVADVTGDGDSVRLVEQKIEKIEEELGSPQVHSQTRGIHRSGCTLLLFEGASMQTEKVAFQRYYAPRHAQHESLELHQAHLLCYPSGRAWLEHAIASFTTKFIRQMVKLTHFEKLNPGVPSSKAIVRFGHHYLIHLPWSFHEESISHATIEMLEQEFERGRETRELYESVLVARKEARRDAARQKEPSSEYNITWEDEVHGGDVSGDTSTETKDTPRPKRAPLPLQKATAMTPRDRGVAHSFYPMIPPSLVTYLDDFVWKHQNMRLAGQSESYQVSIVRDSLEFNVRLTPTLQRAKIKTRANRWLSATLKMRQELVDDQSRMDATPDVRFYVSGNEDVPSSDELHQLLERACAQAPGGCGVLAFLPSSADELPPVRISDELLREGIQVQNVVNVRHVRCTTFEKDGLLLRVLSVREFTFPSADPSAGFLRVTPKTEVEMVMPSLTPSARVDAGFARRFLLAGVELVEFLRERARDAIDDDANEE